MHNSEAVPIWNSYRNGLTYYGIELSFVYIIICVFKLLLRILGISVANYECSTSTDSSTTVLAYGMNECNTVKIFGRQFKLRLTLQRT